MVKEKILKNKKMKCYYCEECEMAYLDKKRAYECEDWCRKHMSCNLEIIKYAVKTR